MCNRDKPTKVILIFFNSKAITWCKIFWETTFSGLTIKFEISSPLNLSQMEKEREIKKTDCSPYNITQINLTTSRLILMFRGPNWLRFLKIFTFSNFFLTKVVVILCWILRGFVIFSFYFWNIFRTKNLNSRLKNAKKRLNISLNGLYTLHLGLSHNEPCEVSIFTNLTLHR